MDLVNTIEFLKQTMEKAGVVREKKGAKSVKKDAKELRKIFRKIKIVSIDDALHMQDVLSNVKLVPLLDDQFWFFPILNEVKELKVRNSEVFMDADAIQVRNELEISTPGTDEIMRFKVKVIGFPIEQKRSLLLEQTRKLVDITLPVLKYEGLAKLSPSLFYIDWIGYPPKENAYFLGHAYDDRPPSVFPLSMISSTNVPSMDPKYDFGFVLSSPNKTDDELLRKFRKTNVVLDYHPLSEFLVRIKVDRLKGESKEDYMRKRQSAGEFLKEHARDGPIDVGWTFAHARFLGTGFPPVNRGKLLEPGSELRPLPSPVDFLPMTPDDYIQTVKDKFDEDNITPNEGIIDEIQVIYGARWVAYERTTLTGGPIPIVPTKQTIRNYCVAALGVMDTVSLEQIKKFSKSSVSFAKDKLPKGAHYVIDIPVLLANKVDVEARSWVERKIEKPYNAFVVPSILNLKNGALYYCKSAPIGGRYNYDNARMFIERYLISEEMRWIKQLNAPKKPKCPHCGAQYRVDESLTEITCQNCLKVYTLN